MEVRNQQEPCPQLAVSPVGSTFASSSYSHAVAKLLHKIDLRLLPFLSWIYLLAFLDRVNIGSVHSTLRSTLSLSDSEFSLGVGVFFIGYCIFEIPSNLMLKRFTPSRWISRIMFSWGIIMTIMAFVWNLPTLLILRFALGVCEAGFFPGILYYLTFWYPAECRALRIAYFYTAGVAAGAVAGILGYFLLQLEGTLGLHGWQWVFIVEGIPSAVFGVITWFYLPDFPETSKWLTAEEKLLLKGILDKSRSLNTNKGLDLEAIELDELDEDISPPDSEDDENPKKKQKAKQRDKEVAANPSTTEPTLGSTLAPPLSLKEEFQHVKEEVKTVILDRSIWSFVTIYIGIVTPLYCVSFFLPAIIASFGYDQLISNLLTVPIYSMGVLVTLIMSNLSDKKRERGSFLMYQLACSCIGFISLLSLDIWLAKHEGNIWRYLSVAIAGVGLYPSIPCALAWLTDEVARGDDKGVDARTATATALVISVGNLGGLFGPLIFGFSQDQYDSYVLGYGLLIILEIISIAFVIHKRITRLNYLT